MHIRKVAFNRFIPHEYEQNHLGRHALVPGTGQYQSDFPNTGLFHQWAPDYEELSQGPANFTVAIIELSDGSIVTIPPQHVKFLDSPHFTRPI